jgi:hypothetical protein
MAAAIELALSEEDRFRCERRFVNSRIAVVGGSGYGDNAMPL